MRRIFRIAGASIAVYALPLVALAQGSSPRTIRELVEKIVEVLNSGTMMLIALALVVFLYGAAINFVKSGERGSSALRPYLVWGVIILFVMVSIWGILRLIQATLLGSATGAADTGVGAFPY